MLADYDIKWILFDLDNTLLDFNKGAEVALRETFAHFNLLNDEANLIASYHQINHACWDQYEKGLIDIYTLKTQRFFLFITHNKLKLGHEALNHYYLTKLAAQTKPITGAQNLLKYLSSRFELVLATNGFPEVQYPRITKARLHPYFKHIIVSEEIGHSKPSNRFFDFAFEKMGSPDRQTVMIIGDSLSSDIRGGRDYGIRTCWFNPDGKETGTEITPDHVVSRLAQIPSLWYKS